MEANTAAKGRENRRSHLLSSVSWRRLALLQCSCEKTLWKPPSFRRMSSTMTSSSSSSTSARTLCSAPKVEASVEVTSASRYPIAVVLVLGDNGTNKRRLRATCRFYQSRNCSTVAVRRMESPGRVKDAVEDAEVVMRIAIQEMGRLLRAADLTEPQRAGHVGVVVHQGCGRGRQRGDLSLVAALRRQLDQFHDGPRCGVDGVARSTAFPPQIVNWNDGYGAGGVLRDEDSPQPPEEHSRILGSISGKSSRRLLAAPPRDLEEQKEEEEQDGREQNYQSRIVSLYAGDREDGEDGVPYTLSKTSSAASSAAHTAAETLSMASTSSFLSFSTPITFVTLQSSQQELREPSAFGLTQSSGWYPSSLLPPQYLISAKSHGRRAKEEEEDEEEDDDDGDSQEARGVGQEVVLQSPNRGSQRDLTVSTPPTTEVEVTHCLPERRNKLVRVGRSELARPGRKEEVIGWQSMTNDSRAFRMDMGILSSRLLRRGCVIYDAAESRPFLGKSLSFGSLSKMMTKTRTTRRRRRRKMPRHKKLESTSLTSEGEGSDNERHYACLKDFGDDFLPTHEDDDKDAPLESTERPLLAFCAQTMEVRRRSRKEEIDRQLQLLAGNSSSDDSSLSSFGSDDDDDEEEGAVSRWRSPHHSHSNVARNEGAG